MSLSELNSRLNRHCHFGNVDEVMKDVAGRADVNNHALEHGGNTPLHMACRAGHVEVIKILLENGASHDARNNRGETPAHSAAFGGRSEALEALHAAGADMDALTDNSYENAPIDLLFINRNTPTEQKIETLVKLNNLGVVIAQDSIEARHTVFSSMRSQDYLLIDKVFEYGLSADCRNSDGKPFIAVAAAHGDIKAMEIAKKHGADVNAASEIRGYSALHAAAYTGNEDAVDWLLENGANPKQMSTGGSGWKQTPSQIANIRNYKRIETKIRDCPIL